ncbi:aldehyde dehydrogenase [Schizosaccharomyces japonicus yFS275]|uniref:Aldehyde dehydrogenase n=1 Tax=Schizosaccharomyces japonicus (strain yFS275 / FY16936) TaxID=402676 RepID=B6K520_SCHJY|nr:aldehyde dehydrogenase [Schizosaccharomyces japonicus yFS275]EEB08624.1 aldehyde dehydrogenase [Schizosaccharomyces japonicus yFS275]
MPAATLREIPAVKIELPNGLTVDQPVGLFINNKFVDSAAGGRIEVIDPATEKHLCDVVEAREEDIDVAVAAARAAFHPDAPWRKFSSAQRGRCLSLLADKVYEHLELLASVETVDNGKSITLARGDVRSAAECIRYYGGWADKEYGQTIETDTTRFAYTRHEPIGVCAQVIPWNFPILMFAWKIAPALACGNTVVLKTAEQTPLSALMLTSFIEECGFPAGVINVVSGYGKHAGAALSAHMDVDKIAFTGSTGVGRMIMRAAAASNLKMCTLELGGKSPNIVFDDADLDKAVAWTNYGIFYNQGQVCCAGSRLYVQEGIYDEFVKRMVAKAKTLKVGNPFDEDTFQGAQVSKAQYERILSYIDLGLEHGAKLEIGGKRHGDRGYFIEPTILSNVTEEMAVGKEEIFGPVVAIIKFKTIEEAIRRANNTSFGLASGVHTRSIDTALQVSNALQAGTVWVNCYNVLHHQIPFGGYKESGIGRELGSYGLSNYTQTKAVHINTGMNLPL